MLNALRLSLPTRRPAALLVLLLCTCFAGGPLAAPVLAQGSLVAPAQTKEEAKQAREAAEKAKDDGGGISVEAALALTGLLLLAGAVIYMVRDSNASVIADERRPPGVSRSTARGAPKNMFEGEAKPGGQAGKTKKRAKGKRQKQARRANRPR